ncbi:MAG: type II toxin-antitoxin system RelE/ParE family toxin [Victivallales bacterium]|nr:type II toxin-antitoxin system RelE/ParE family toxin [Victivallales bacterium]
MELDFKTKHLVDLYTKGKSRKYKLPKGVPLKFVERIGKIEAADTINDLREPPSMKFEKLQGYDNRFSIRINQQYRLVFEIEFKDEEKTFGDVLILDISNHYS